MTESVAPRPLPDPPPRLAVGLALGLRRLLQRAADALVPPQLALFDRVVGVGATQLIRAAARLGLADLLAATPRSAAELARATGADPDALHRLLRGLVAIGLFRRGRDGRFHNNRLSRALRSGGPGSLRDYALYFGSAANVRAWSDLDRSLAGAGAENGGSAFERVHGATIWDWFDAHPDERETFAGAMGELTELYASAVASARPFGAVRRLCDVGGGRGTLLAEILLRHPRIEGVLLESHGVVEAARPFLAARGVLDRVELVAGSFFAAVPAGCDAYLLKNVLHDWDDARCREILGACRRAMAPGALLLVVETVVEADTVRDLGPLSDLQMMMVCSGGRERSREELARLYKECGFRLERVLATASPMSLVQGVAV
ncbi:MAG TPA: methyltransferase [Thermoanaerobaculia bacterium]|nr:methyltransferase [Thermoanaerobaculia bacterium]